MAYSVHPVIVTREEREYELLFMSEDDAFEFAASRKFDPKECVSVGASIRLNETVEEGVDALKHMVLETLKQTVRG